MWFMNVFCCSFVTRSVLHVHASLIYILRLPFIYYIFGLMSPYQTPQKLSVYDIKFTQLLYLHTNQTSLQISCNLIHAGVVILMYTGKGFSWLVMTHILFKQCRSLHSIITCQCWHGLSCIYCWCTAYIHCDGKFTQQFMVPF